MKITDVEHRVVDIDATREHAYNQANVRRLRSGDLVAVYNEERFPYHHDSGQTVMLRSRDNGATWVDRTVVLPYTDTTANWDCGICELDDGALLVNFTMAAYFKRGIRPEQPSWTRGPRTDEHGDWTWSFKTMGWLGTYVVKSTDGGASWCDPIPVNARPLKHAGCRLGCWPIGDSLLMGVYGRIRGYGEEGENESTRSALLRSDDGGDNWEYYSTMAFDAASIVDFEEPAIVPLADGRMVGMLRTHVNPSGDAKNMAIVVSEDDGFSWSQPRFTNIWGYPAEFATLPDGRILMIYGYRRPPYGVRACVSEDGITWDVADEFTIREGGVPAAFYDNPGVYQHIGYPSVALLGDGRCSRCTTSMTRTASVRSSSLRARASGSRTEPVRANRRHRVGCEATLRRRLRALGLAREVFAVTEPLRSETEDRVRVITLTRAEEYNTINPALRDALGAALDEADDDRGVNAVLLRAEGPAFCAGYQLDWATSGQAETQASGGRVWDSVTDLREISRYAQTWAKLHKISKPTIAAVQGWCIAGGTNMVLNADLIVCSESARFGYPPMRVWGIPEAPWVWVARLGLERAKRYLFTGDEISGTEAASLGLVLECVGNDQLDDHARALARRIALLPLAQLQMIKWALNDTAREMYSPDASRMLGSLFDGVARHTQEGLDFVERSVDVGFRQAVRERDDPFGDYGSRPRP